MNRVKGMDEEYRDSRFKTQVIIDYIAGKISRRSASIKLHTSETYVSTLKKQYLCSGDKAFVHGNSGRTSSRKLPDDIEEDICRLYETGEFTRVNPPESGYSQSLRSMTSTVS